MVLYLEHILSGKTQTLNNIISVSEKESIIEVTTTTETFKIDTNKVKFTLTVSINTRDKLMDELNIRMDELLEKQRNNQITDGLQDVENIKDFIKNYTGVSEHDKNELIAQINLLAFEVIMKKKLSE